MFYRARGCLSFPVLFLSRIPHVPSKCRGLYLKSMARFMQKNCGHETTFFSRRRERLQTCRGTSLAKRRRQCTSAAILSIWVSNAT